MTLIGLIQGICFQVRACNMLSTPKFTGGICKMSQQFLRSIWSRLAGMMCWETATLCTYHMVTIDWAIGYLRVLLSTNIKNNSFRLQRDDADLRLFPVVVQGNIYGNHGFFPMKYRCVSCNKSSLLAIWAWTKHAGSMSVRTTRWSFSTMGCPKLVRG